MAGVVRTNMHLRPVVLVLRVVPQRLQRLLQQVMMAWRTPVSCLRCCGRRRTADTAAAPVRR